jgi:hypothetical protein
MVGIGEISRRAQSLLSPNLERLGRGASIAGCRQELAPRREMTEYQDCSLSDAVAAQPICDEALWLVLQTTWQVLERSVAAALFRRSCTRISSTMPC